MINMPGELTYTAEQEEQIKQYLRDEKTRAILNKINVYDENSNDEKNLGFIKDYISDVLRGRYRGNIAIESFINCIETYKENEDFERFKDNEQGYDGIINYNLVLPISSNERFKVTGFRRRDDILGPDGNIYIVKEAERLKGTIAGRENSKDGLYNPTVATAVFDFLGEECAEYIPAYEKFPYYYIISKNFLGSNQKMYRLDNYEFFGQSKIEQDENGNIKHSQIMQMIEEAIRDKYSNEFSKDEIDVICSKLKLQYTTQETIKKLIDCMDENLGNTSIIVTEDENGKVKDINVSPAYDLDLSFLLGEELINTDYSNGILYRTAENGEKDMKSIMNEFEAIPGYKEKIQGFTQKFTEDYAGTILNIAYKNSRVKAFQEEKWKEKYGAFIRRKVAYLKAISKEIKDKNEISK